MPVNSRPKGKAPLEPLKITCTSSQCDKGLHCFRASKKMAKADQGKCRSCGANLIDWQRIHRRWLGDVAFTAQALKYEMIRHHFWHKPIDEHAQNHARRKGRLALREAVRSRLKKSVAPAQPPFDGRQTPTSGNIIFYAQHAMACCCRTCMEYWHGVPKGVELTDEQIEYFIELVMTYINDRMPELSESGEWIPAIRYKRSGDQRAPAVH